jgi:transposase InsO family protein
MVATCRLPGYPCRKVLASWVDALRPGTRHVIVSTNSRAPFTPGQKGQAVIELFNRNHRCYGYRRIHAVLRRCGTRISEKVVRRLMAQEALVVYRPRQRRYSSYCGEIGPAPENLLARDFHADSPNQKWLTDITEFQLPIGKVYLSPVIDCFDGKVVSWAVGTRPDAQLVNFCLMLPSACSLPMRSP